MELKISNSKVNVDKKGIRVLGIAESFIKKKIKKSILAGVVMRVDGIIDGITLSSATIGGMDATESIISLFNSLKRRDINVIILNGCAISWFNIIDLEEVYRRAKIPLICITYDESIGLKKYLKEYFKNDWENRYKIYRKNGRREKIELHTKNFIFVRVLGLELEKAKMLLDKLTIHGSIPEPLRISRLYARAVLKHIIKEN